MYGKTAISTKKALNYSNLFKGCFGEQDLPLWKKAKTLRWYSDYLHKEPGFCHWFLPQIWKAIIWWNGFGILPYHFNFLCTLSHHNGSSEGTIHAITTTTNTSKGKCIFLVKNSNHLKYTPKSLSNTTKSSNMNVYSQMSISIPATKRTVSRTFI